MPNSSPLFVGADLADDRGSMPDRGSASRPSGQASLPIDPELLRQFGQLAEATGGAEFYPQLARLIAGILDCRRWLVLRYAPYAAPEFIVNAAMTADAVKSYLDGLYRLDPLLRLVRSGVRDGVFVLSEIRTREGPGAYFDRIFQLSMIYDEAAILLATPGNSSIAICVERDSGQFSDGDHALLSALHPLIRSLHLVHLARIFTAPPPGQEPAPRARQHQAVLILDRHYRPVYRNERWAALEQESGAPDLALVRKSPDGGMQPLDPGAVLHWERLPESFGPAPGGYICTVEARSPGYITVDFGEALDQFQLRHRLTRRERDIVELVLQGHPNVRIAEKLNLAEGTVRNYRHRLYYKLDITTERELFFLFIEHLLGRDEQA